MKKYLHNALTSVLLCLMTITGFGQSPDLGTASNFTLFTAVGAFDNIGAGTTATGDVGTNVGAFTAFPPGTLFGEIHVADAVSAQAALDVNAAYAYLSTLPCGAVLGTTMGSGQVLTPNTYCLGAASTLNGELILDGQGNPDAIFIFQIDGAFTTGTFSTVTLINSASLCNIYWQVNGQFSLGDNSIFRGTLINSGAINLLEGATLLGRALSTSGAISLHNNIVTISSEPVAAIITAGGPVAFCEGGSVTLSGNIDGTWSTGATTSSITVTTAGDYFVTNTNACGTVTSNHINVTINTSPVAAIITPLGPTEFCAGGSLTIIGNVSGVWSTGETSASITVTTAGDYFVTNTNACGTVNSNHVIVTINPLPVAAIITADGPVAFCDGGSVILSGNIDGTWSTGETTSSITVTTAGDYFVTNTNACGTVTSNHINVTINASPVAAIITPLGPTEFCAGGSLTIIGNVSGVWSTGETSASITVTTAGDYFVTNTNACGTVNSNHVIVTINPSPVAAIITADGPVAFCDGGSVTLSGNIDGTWSTGETTSSITVTTAGDYFVTNTNACGTVTSNHLIITISPAPVASVITASGATEFCLGGEVILSGNVGGTWSTGETTSSIIVTTAGDYFVTNTNACGTVTSNHIIITISPAPIASVITASGAIEFCLGGTVILSGNVGGTWSTGETTSSITVTTAGDYFVTNTNACGTVTSNHINVTISASPVATIISAGGPTDFCEGGSVILSGNIDGTWSTGETTSSITVTTAGDYFVTNTNACGTVTSNHLIITISPAPIASVITASGATEFCLGGTVILSGNVGGTWSTGETTSSITVTTAGDYFVTNTNACGSVTSNHINVTISASPVATIISAGGPTDFCEGGSGILSGNIDGTWSTGETTSTIVVTTAGDYFVTNTNACGTVTSNHIIITISPAPIASVITASGATEFCLGGEVILSGNVGGTWSTGETTSSITVTTAGDYFVTNTNACGTVTSNHINVTISASPVAAIISAEGPVAFCEGGSVILSGNIDGTWSTGETTSTIVVTTAGDYFVTNTNACGTVTSNHLIITISPAPVASVITASGATEFCLGGTVILSGNVGGTWSTGETTSSITVTTAGDYFVTNTNACGTVTSNHIIITISASPVAAIISAGGPTDFCEGGSVILSGNIDGTWSTGETTSSITVITAGDYFVTNTNACGTVTSNHIIITISPAPIASVITASGATEFCLGGEVILSGNVGGTWSTGETTSSITVTTAGDYFVTNTNACGTVTSNHINVTISASPVAAIISAEGPVAFCEGGSVILSGNIDGTWSTGETTSSITVTTTGDYFVTNTNACGTVTSNHLIITISPAPIASVITASGATEFCLGGTVILSGNVGGTWSTGETTSSITVTTAGDYFVTNTNACGSVTSNHINVTISASPVAAIIIAEGAISFCPGASVILSGNIDGTWNTGETTTTIIASAAGDYFVTNTNACGTVTSNHIIITIYPLPICNITGDVTICEGESTHLCAPLDCTDFLWNTGDTTGCIDVTISGTYTVTITNGGGCMSTCSKTVIVTPLPIASIITSEGETTFCEGNNVILSGNVGGVWNTGATTSSITVIASGDYFVINSNECGSVASNHIIVTVNALPVCNITGDASICVGETTHLCAPAGYASYLWSTGSTSGCISVAVAGIYTVTITNASGCTSTCSKKVIIYEAPVASVISAAGPITFCEGNNVILSGNVGGVWNTGATTSTITVNTSGDYYVTNSTGCGSIISNHIIVVVNPLPICKIQGEGKICFGDTTHLCAPDGYVSYLWSTGATTNCIDVYTAGTYSVTVTNENGCTSTCSKKIHIYAAPVASVIEAEGPVTFCEGNNVILTGNVGGVWNTGATTASIVVNASGNYYVTNSTGCGSVVSNHIIVIVNPLPNCKIKGEGKICEGDTVHLCAAAGYASYLWSTGETTECIAITTAGTYSVTVTTEAGCSSTCSKTIHSYAVPVASVIIASGATSFCAGGSVTLSGNIDGIWNTGSVASAILVTTSGDYYVTNTTGCGSIISNHIIVTVSPIPTCNITGDAIICVGETSHLCAPAGYASYLWSTGATTGCISVTTAGTYSVTITNAGGCSSTCSKMVTVYPAPVESIITASGATTFCEEGTVTLSGNVGGVWNTGATTSSIIVTASGDYYVTNTTGCGSVVSNHIIVTENEIPICEITGDTCICVGETTHVCAPDGYAYYLWNTGATTQCIFVAEIGTYSVTVTNEAGCSSSCDVDVTAGPWKLGETERKLKENNIVVKAYPNPFDSKSTIEFKNTESDSHIIVEFYGVTDNKISILFEGDIEKGVWYQTVVNGENIPSGVYIYRIVNGEQIITGKLVLSK